MSRRNNQQENTKKLKTVIIFHNKSVGITVLVLDYYTSSVIEYCSSTRHLVISSPNGEIIPTIDIKKYTVTVICFIFTNGIQMFLHIMHTQQCHGGFCVGKLASI